MRTAGPRIEAIRFSLLVVLTIGLLSVAFRHDSSPTAHSAKAPSSPSASASPSSPDVASNTPSSPPTSVLPTSSTRAGSTSAGGTTQPTLPMTGWDGAVRLGALGALLVTGGAMSMTASRVPRRRS